MGNFSDNTVNQRFRKIFRHLEDARIIKGKSDIAKKLGTYNHVINSILKGQRNITIDQLQRLFEHFGVNANYLFGLSDDMFLEGNYAPGDIPLRVIGNRKIGARANITLVPERAVAGYALEHQDEDWLDGMQKFAIPGMDSNDMIAFEISGDSMLPTVTSGDLVVCERVEQGASLRDNHVYVIVTDVVVAKRIQQIRDSKGQRLRLISDNKAVYTPYEVDLEDIRQILKVKCRVTNHAIS